MNEYTRYTTNHGQQLRHQNSRSRIGYHAHRGGWEQTTSSPSVGQSRQQPQPVALSLVEPYVIQPEEDIGEDVEDSCCCWISLILLILLMGLIVGLGIIFTREPPNSTQQAPTSTSQTPVVHFLKVKKYHDFL